MSTPPILELPVGTDLPASVVDELNMRLLWIGRQLSNTSTASDSASAATATVIATRNERLNLTRFTAQNYPGAQFYETDTALTYISRPIVAKASGYVWAYLSGNQRGTFSGLPSGLTTLDAGLLYTITDKNRTLRWSGSGWTFAPWEVIPVGYIAGFNTSPGTGWHICDGSTVANGELHADGTLHGVTFPDFTTAGYPKWGATATGFNAAVAPAITGNTADATTGITVSAAAAASAATVSTGTIDDPGAGTPTTVVTALTSGGGGGGGGGAVTDTGHHHAHGTLVNDALGEPRNYGMVAYQRV